MADKDVSNSNAKLIRFLNIKQPTKLLYTKKKKRWACGFIPKNFGGD